MSKPNYDLADALADVDEGKAPDYDRLFTDCLSDVDEGQHPCGTTEHCREMGGCPSCFQAMMRGDIGVSRIEVFRSGVVRLTTVGHDGQTCIVSFRGVPITVRG